MMRDDDVPKWPLKLLRAVCPEHLQEEIEGDLVQRYRKDFYSGGSAKATRKLLWNAIRFFRPGIILRNRFSLHSNRGIMIGNYLKVMMRSLSRQKTFSVINIFGLSTGLTFALVIGLFAWGELQVNREIKDIDRLYLVKSKYQAAEENNIWFAPAPLAEKLLTDHPTLVENYFRFFDRGVTISKGDKHLRVQTMIADSTFLDMFGFGVLFGDRTKALKEPNTLIVTEKIARQYFDRADVAGETITLHTERNGKKEFVISAVITDPKKKNSVSDFMNMDAQVFIPIRNTVDFSVPDPAFWTSDIITYVKLTGSASVEDANAAVNKLLKENLANVGNTKRSLVLDPLKDHYLTTNHGAVKNLVISLTAIVLFILLLAICNFINISIASSFSRLKEIGVRKVIGGVRRQVVFQFLTESILFAGFSGVLSVLVYELTRNYFSNLLGSELPSVIYFDGIFWLCIIGGILFTGILAGAYPAFYLSRTKTIESLKGKFQSVKATINFSRGLISAQFAIAVFVFAAALIMSSQVSFFLEKDLGYDTPFVVTATSVPRLWSPEGFDKVEAAKEQFLSSPRVESLSLSWGAPGINFSPTGSKIFSHGHTDDEGVVTTLTSADEDYPSVFGIQVLEGKFLFSKGEIRTPLALVINESAKKAMNVQLGDQVKMQYWGDTLFTIVGVVKDFNFESLHESLKPVVFLHNRDFQAYRYFSFRLAPGSLAESVREIEAVWKQTFPDDPFVYSFMDEKLESLYRTEFQLRKASSIATVLMIVIVLTGVLGLVSLSVNKRRKEIGVRRVLGASTPGIIVLLSREYAVIMTVSFFVGVPVAYYFTAGWLDGFAYHIDLRWWMFAVPVLVLFSITILIIMFQALKAVLSDPVKALKYE